MHSPNLKFPNESVIIVSWVPPENAGGNLDNYQLNITEEINSQNSSTLINTTGKFTTIFYIFWILHILL